VKKTVKFLDLPARHLPLFPDYCRELKTQLNHSDFILGAGVKTFEQEISKLLGGAAFLSSGNCTDALYLSLKYVLERNSPNREVLVSPMSYLASVSSIVLAGGIPRFIDVDDSLNISVKALSESISKDTAAVVVVHLGGIPADIAALAAVASEYRVPIVEDCAQCFSATYDNRKVGTTSFSGCFSFHPLKLFGGTGDGGGVSSGDQDFLRYFEQARNHGHSTRDDVDFFSHNMRLDSLSARLLTQQLPFIQHEVESRRAIRSRYAEFFLRYGLVSNGCIRIPTIPFGAQPAFNFAMFRFEKRDALLAYLAECMIETRIHYPRLLSELTPFKHGIPHVVSEIGNAHEAVNQILSLPCGSHLKYADVDYVCEAIRNFYTPYA
jgi:dTDP-4-amino-4,6-dideoxygalactose transaminase